MQQHPDAFPASVFTWERFLWAVATVRARIHAPLQGQQAALVPLADLVRGRAPTLTCCCCPLPVCPAHRSGTRCEQEVALGGSQGWQTSGILSHRPDLVHLQVQVQHRRGRTQGWKLQSGGLNFGKSPALSLAADRRLEAGEVVTMDFDADRVDSQILLDYGVLDADSPQVRTAWSQGLAQAAQCVVKFLMTVCPVPSQGAGHGMQQTML